MKEVIRRYYEIRCFLMMFTSMESYHKPFPSTQTSKTWGVSCEFKKLNSITLIFVQFDIEKKWILYVNSKAWWDSKVPWSRQSPMVCAKPRWFERRSKSDCLSVSCRGWNFGLTPLRKMHQSKFQPQQVLLRLVNVQLLKFNGLWLVAKIQWFDMLKPHGLNVELWNHHWTKASPSDFRVLHI